MAIYTLYKYTFPNGKVYIGQTKNEKNRIGVVSMYKGMFVYNAMKKYPNFEIEILYKTNDVNEIDELEREYIKKYNSSDRKFGYNRDLGGRVNHKPTQETKFKISKTQKGQHHSKKTEFKKGHKTSEIIRKKISNSLKKYYQENEIKFKGIKFTEERKQQLSKIKARKVICLNIENGEETLFQSVKEACEKLQICKSSICRNLKGYTNLVSYKYKFRVVQ